MLLSPDGGLSNERGIRSRGFQRIDVCSGNGCPEPASASVAKQVVLSWDGRAVLTIDRKKDPVEARRFEALTFRTMMNASSPLNDGTAVQDFHVVLRDSTGSAASVPAGRYCCGLRRPFEDDGTLYEPEDPASGGHRSLHLNGIRIPLEDFRGVNLARIVAIELRFDETHKGSIQLAELALQR